jgi:predicted aldo/keto reductase-like oxidoreductase
MVIIDWLLDCANFTKSKTVAEFCLRYAKSQNWIDGVVIGMESIQQLHDNLATFDMSDLTQLELDEVIINRPKIDEMTLNPACWD